MTHLTYLVTILVFCGTVLLIMYRRRGEILRRQWPILLIVSLLGVPLAAIDWFGLHWRAWNYFAGSTLDVRFITEIETYLFAVGVFAAVAAATLIWAAKTDMAAAAKRSTRKAEQ